MICMGTSWNGALTGMMIIIIKTVPIRIRRGLIAENVMLLVAGLGAMDTLIFLLPLIVTGLGSVQTVGTTT